MKLNSILQIVTICQAVWVLVLMSFLMYHYIVKSVKNRYLEQNALFMGISYMLLTGATVISSLKGVYNWYDPWQLIVMISYVFGDIVIVKMLWHVSRNDQTKKVLNEYIKKHKTNNKT